MASIQITDLNSSDSGLMYELCEAELLDINGGGWFKKIFGGIAIIGGTILGFLPGGATVGVPLIAGGAAIIASD
jgi:hypothetical protein